MKSYLGLVKEYAKAHQKRNRLTLYCIVIAVSLVTTVFGMADMALRAMKQQYIKIYGNWHIAISDFPKEQARELEHREDILQMGYGLSIGLKDGVSCKGNAVAVTGMEKKEAEFFGAKLAEGSFPKGEREASLTQSAAENWNIGIGDSVTLELADGRQEEFTVTGIMNDTSATLAAGAAGVIMTPEAFRSCMEGMAYGDRFYITFRERGNMRNSIRQIREQFGLDGEEIGENAVLMAVMGQSGDASMNEFYITAFVLFLLVLASGVLIIAGSFNTNIVERSRFFGMLRCLGASKVQVRRLVLKEGIRYGYTAIPAGMAIGTAVVWGLCMMLKISDAMFFAYIPLWSISLPSLLMGAVTGFLTVVFSSLSPCRRAAKVSPLSAVSGNRENGIEIGIGQEAAEKARSVSKGIKIEYRLGIRNALAVRKSMFLLAASFAVSIILFLGFSVMVDFMHHAIRPLHPWYPDVSIVSGDNTLSLRKEIGAELETTEGIKRVYGRKFAYDLPVEDGKGAEYANLISYEKYQFGWAGENLRGGNLDWTEQQEQQAAIQTEAPVKVMAAQSDIYQWEIGDRVRIHTPQGSQELEIAAVTASSVFGREEGKENFICTEDGFMRLMGDEASGYTIYDIQLEEAGEEDAVQAVKALTDDTMTFSDRRQSNRETRAVYWIFAFFVYGFLVVIALITVCGIMNSMNLSINSRMTRYGIMRAVGMSGRQLYRMIYAESLTYAFLGAAAGCLLGVPLHYGLYHMAILIRWDAQWKVPALQLGVIVSLSVLAVVISVAAPVKRIREMNIVETISML